MGNETKVPLMVDEKNLAILEQTRHLLQIQGNGGGMFRLLLSELMRDFTLEQRLNKKIADVTASFNGTISGMDREFNEKFPWLEEKISDSEADIYEKLNNLEEDLYERLLSSLSVKLQRKFPVDSDVASADSN